MRLKKFLPFTLAILGLLLSAGCASTAGKPTEKELAQKRWAAARAGVLVTLAKDQYANGQFEKSRKTVDEALRLAPENPQAHMISARLLIEQGQLEAAERHLASARQFAPNDGEAYYLSGVIMQRWQKHTQAHELYKTASSKSPAELAYVLAEAESLVTLDRLPEGLALLQSKADYFEHSGAIRDAIGQLLMQQGRFAEAARAFRQACILTEDDQSLRERLGLALYRAGEFREAADVLSKLTQNEPFSKRPDLLSVLGESQLASGQAREARFSYEAASQLDPYAPSVWRGLGRAALESGDLRRAELSLNKALRYDPLIAETHLLLGTLYLKQERPAEAIKAFEQASTLNPRDTVAICMIGYGYERLGQPRTAARYYAQALRLKPTDELARKLMAGVE